MKEIFHLPGMDKWVMVDKMVDGTKEEGDCISSPPEKMQTYSLAAVDYFREGTNTQVLWLATTLAKPLLDRLVIFVNICIWAVR